jgi:dTDP-4-dehydrorhamnose 3,5-epimerase
MKFSETKVKGAYLVELDRREDHRGFFARSWCAREFEAQGLNPRVVQINVGFTAKRAGLRGLHYQLPPHAEAKTVRCTHGRVFDVVLDLRPDSPSHKQWEAFELSAENHKMLYIPEGCAHGYQTMTDNAEIEYLTSAFYASGAATGVRFDDPAFNINWPLPLGSISDADRSWPDYVG